MHRHEFLISSNDDRPRMPFSSRSYYRLAFGAYTSWPPTSARSSYGFHRRMPAFVAASFFSVLERFRLVGAGTTTYQRRLLRRRLR